MKELFNKYKLAKSQLYFDYKGYMIHNLISVDLSTMIYGKYNFTYKSLLNIFTYKNIKINTTKKILFSMGNYNRNEQYEQLAFVRKGIDSDLIDLKNFNRRLNISLKNIFMSSNLIFRNEINLNFKLKVALVVIITQILNTIDKLESNIFPKSVVKFCSFCSTHKFEGILDYYFQKHDVRTYTLQHGIYYIFKDYIVESVIFENIIAQKLLCWGQYTKDEFMSYGIKKDKLVVCGYPCLISKIKPKTIRKEKLRILVLLSRIYYHENNIKLLDLLDTARDKSENFSIDIKLHPSLNQSIYKVLAKEKKFNLLKNISIDTLYLKNEYDFSIVYNSTTYYQSYIHNCICLKYIDAEADESINILDDGFSNANELLGKIELFKHQQCKDDFWDDIYKKLRYTVGVGINNYASELDIDNDKLLVGKA